MAYTKFTGPLWGGYLLVSHENLKLVRANLLAQHLTWKEEDNGKAN